MRRALIYSLIALAITALAACGPSNAEMARDVEAFGFTDVQITGSDWWACSKDDNFARRFIATNATGRRVSGVVCRGWLKGATVRID